jgi:hypothetical protein
MTRRDHNLWGKGPGWRERERAAVQAIAERVAAYRAARAGRRSRVIAGREAARLNARPRDDESS